MKRERHYSVPHSKSLICLILFFSINSINIFYYMQVSIASSWDGKYGMIDVIMEEKGVAMMVESQKSSKIPGGRKVE